MWVPVTGRMVNHIPTSRQHSLLGAVRGLNNKALCGTSTLYKLLHLKNQQQNCRTLRTNGQNFMSYTKRLNKPPFPMHNPATPRGSTSTAFAEKESPSPTHIYAKIIFYGCIGVSSAPQQSRSVSPQKKTLMYICTLLQPPSYSQ